MKKLSLVASSLLLASSLSANSIDEAFKAGNVSGDITLYGERQNNDGSNPDAGFTMGSIGLSYETGELNGFKAAVGFRGNHDFSEVEDGDYSDGSEQKAIIHTANISYANEYLGLTFGRQEIDLEWLGDFHEAAVLGVTAIPDTTVVLGYTQRIAVADADAVLEEFTDFGEDIDYAAVFDVKYEGIKDLVINPYYYKADNLAKWYGLKADYDTDIFGVTAHGAQSSEDIGEDGDIAHLEGRFNIAGFGFNLGYITTDKNVGAGSMSTLGENINPFDALRGGDGEKVYDADTDTTYLNVTYELPVGVELGALYGQMDSDGNKDKELDLTVDYSITDNLSVGALYVNLNAENSDEDYDKFTLTVEYSF